MIHSWRCLNQEGKDSLRRMFADRQKEHVSRNIDPDEKTLLKITSISIQQLSLNVHKTVQYNIKLYNLIDELVKVED